jgi:hypothetical protein
MTVLCKQRWAAAALLLAASCALAQERPAAGTIDFVEGDAMVETKDKQTRIAKTGEPVFAAETITTFKATELHLKMADGGFLSLRENTKITLTEYVANGDDGDRSLIDLAKGAFRSVTGWIGKHRPTAYRVRTPMVTIGVRGTDHEPTHFEPGDPRGAPGSYDKVNEGRTVMQSKFGTVEVPANRAAHFHTDQRAAPRVLQSVPTFFRPAKNEQRFAQRAQESAKTVDRQRATRRDLVQKQRVEKKGVQPKAAEKKASDRKGLDKKSFDKKQALEKKQRPVEKKQQFDKKQQLDRKQQFDKKQFEKKTAPGKSAERRFEKKHK